MSNKISYEYEGGRSNLFYTCLYLKEYLNDSLKKVKSKVQNYQLFSIPYEDSNPDFLQSLKHRINDIYKNVSSKILPKKRAHSLPSKDKINEAYRNLESNIINRSWKYRF